MTPHPNADYKVRIFTPRAEVPFAGHPTLGTAPCVAGEGRIAAGPKTAGPGMRGRPGQRPERRRRTRLRRPAPAQVRHGRARRTGPGQQEPRHRPGPRQQLGGQRPRLAWDPPGFRQEVLDLRPDFATMDQLNMGVIAANKNAGPADYEVRAFAPGHDVTEDPVTGRRRLPHQHQRPRRPQKEASKRPFSAKRRP
ncbi:PhzF family phenazine biosynthesis protein [Arthrobacter sp. ISL-65]|uniref:PhzF family phenazine biosynthesis protein n=1 Tax=Arthrobacter sp. ISL-65 TaxID=2819112 RepID=UPI0035A8D435